MPEITVTKDLVKLQSMAVSKLEGELAAILGKARKLTLRRLVVFGRDMPALRAYRLPLKPLLRTKIRRYLDEVYASGGESVLRERPILKFTARRSMDMRNRADMIVDDITTRMEVELRTGWVRYRKIRMMMLAHTNKVFDDWGAH